LNMGETNQSGQLHAAQGVHPDADQLSAFLEQALPAHEREVVLAHLALCRDCRAMVALALPAIEEAERAGELGRVAVAAARVAQGASDVAAAPIVASVRRRKLISWTIWFPAATALAALALFFAFVHRAPKPVLREQAGNVAQQSTAEPPQQVQTAETGAVSAGAAAGKPVQPVEKKSAPAQELALNRIEGRERAPLAAARPLPMAPPPAPSPNFDERMKAGASLHGMSGGAMGSEGVAPATVPQTAGQPAESFAGAGIVQEPIPQQPSNAAQQLSVPATRAREASGAAAAPSETTFAAVANASTAARAIHGEIFERPLPSRQSVLSTASYGSRMLAIDARHAVFLSTNSGMQWKQVSGQWKGQAIQVNLVLGAGANGQFATYTPSANLAAVVGLSRQAAKELQGNLTGTVTDATGAVIPGVTVTLTDAAAGNTRTAQTDSKGQYAVGRLAPGNYKVDATAPGFENLHLEGISINAPGPNVANLKMQVAASTESVTVEAAKPELETDKSASKRVVSSQGTPQPPAMFVITTDTGERWTSVDGETWKQE
jgi:hypothetical protein